MFKPILAASVENVEKLPYPMLASPKLDGVRAIVRDGTLVSRSLKPIPNRGVQNFFRRPEFEGLDGELICGSPTDPDCFRNTTSAVMSVATNAKVNFHVFDFITTERECPFNTRQILLRSKVKNISALLEVVPQTLVTCVKDVQAYEALRLEQGYEGIILRSLDGPYKHGRSTLKESYLLKLKRFVDSEAVIVECIEQRHNDNEAKVNALGQKERSSAKEGMIGAGVLGALSVWDRVTGVLFEIGTGFTATDRAVLWNQRSTLVGKVVKYKYFPTGSKDRPRFPVYIGFRDVKDMS